MIKTTLLAAVIMLGGCAASPDTRVYVEKDVIIYTDGDVTVTYEANSTVVSDAKLDGTVSPDIDLSLPIP